MAKNSDPVRWYDELSFPDYNPQRRKREPVEGLRAPTRYPDGTPVYVGESAHGHKISVMCMATNATAPSIGPAAPPTVSSSPSRKTKATSPVVDGLNFVETATKPISKPPLVLEGALYRGAILGLGGSSKSHKSFALIDLAVCVATGEKFWVFPTVQGKVIYVNLELQRFALSERLTDIIREEHVTLAAGQLGVWNLRGHYLGIEEIVDTLIEHYSFEIDSPENISLIIIDPVYKCYGSRDENNASQMTDFFSHLERLASKTGAAVAFAAHFAKGNSSLKSAVDRISGSGVFARYPDAMLLVTEIKGKVNFYTGETVLRNFQAVDPFVLEWEYPLLEVIHTSMMPAPTTGSGGSGRPPSASKHSVTNILNGRILSYKAWKGIAMTTFKISVSTFKKYKKEAEADGLVAKDAKGNWYAVTSPPAARSIFSADEDENTEGEIMQLA